MKTLSERLWPKVDKSDASGCWVWTGSKLKFGHGRIVIGKKSFSVHRVSWELHHGPVFGEACVLHKCDNPACVKPSHLFLGTKGDNNRDRAAKGRSADSHGERHSHSKLSELEVSWIKRIAKTKKIPQVRIAKMFNISQPHVSSIISGRYWARETTCHTAQN